MRPDNRSATPLVRPHTDTSVRERQTLRGRVDLAFGALANRVSLIVGSPWAFTVAVLTIVGWAVTGPAFGYSDTW